MSSIPLKEGRQGKRRRTLDLCVSLTSFPHSPCLTKNPYNHLFCVDETTLKGRPASVRGVPSRPGTHRGRDLGPTSYPGVFKLELRNQKGDEERTGTQRRKRKDRQLLDLKSGDVAEEPTEDRDKRDRGQVRDGIQDRNQGLV